jgi:CCR4-NOT transcription complex subunit 4
MWCWDHIRKNLNGLCPACRTPYKEDPHAFSAVDTTSAKAKKKQEKKEKVEKDKVQKQDNSKGVVASASVSAAAAAVASAAANAKAAPGLGTAPMVDRRHLHNYRVIQRNLLYVIGLPSGSGSDEVLRRAEYFGQYGKIAKIVIHKNQNAAHNSVSAYITFSYKEDAKAAIQAIEGFTMEGHHLRASFGTTKYCNNFIRGFPCTNPECVYLHELGDDEDRFTKEEIQAGQSKIMPNPGKDQTLVTGRGGPSGTGKRPGPTDKLVLPQPTFIQDKNKAGAAATPQGTGKVVSWASGGGPSIKEKSSMKEGSSVKGHGENMDKKAATAAVAAAAVVTTAASTAVAQEHANSKPGTKTSKESSETRKHDAAKEVTAKEPSNAEIRKAARELEQEKRRAEQKERKEKALENQRQQAEKENVAAEAKKKAREAAAAEAEAEAETAEADAEAAAAEAGVSVLAAARKKEKSRLEEQQDMTPSPAAADTAIANAIDSVDLLRQPIYNGKIEPSFNGFGRCAVFPVPISSLTMSAWANVLANTASYEGEGFGEDPFLGTKVTISEMLEITLPPVDAVCLQPWPKPLSHYGPGVIPRAAPRDMSTNGEHVGAVSTPAAPTNGSLSALKTMFPNANVKMK